MRCAKFQPVAEITFQAAIFFRNRLKGGGQERRFDRPQHSSDFIRKIAAGVGVAPVEAVGKQIIVGDHIVGHSEGMQDQRAGKAGAVLAGGTVNHKRRAILQQMAEQGTEARRVVTHIVAVGIAHHVDRVDRRQRRAGRGAGAQRRNHGRLDRQRMNRDFADAAERGDTLFGAAKVERASHAQAAQDCNVGLRDMAEMIGAEDLPPADLASVAGGIAAEIAKIAGALKIEMTGRGV